MKLEQSGLLTIPEFRMREPVAFGSDQAVYHAIRTVPGFPSVRLGRRVFIDVGRWEEFKRSGGRSLAGGWRRQPAA